MTAKTLELAYTTAAILNMQVSGVNVSNSVSGFILHDFISVNTYFFLAICQDGDVRLSGGRNPSEGQVEICFNNQWGRICPNSWDVADAAVVCTQLGLPSDSKLANSMLWCIQLMREWTFDSVLKELLLQHLGKVLDPYI